MSEVKVKPIITIERTGCYGTCPVYSARIYLDGTVVFKGEIFVKALGESRHKITDSKISELIAAFEDVGFYSLKNVYESDVTITCQPSTITTFNLNGRRKRIVNHSASPLILERLENKIDRLAGLRKLIGKRN